MVGCFQDDEEQEIEGIKGKRECIKLHVCKEACQDKFHCLIIFTFSRQKKTLHIQMVMIFNLGHESKYIHVSSRILFRHIS